MNVYICKKEDEDTDIISTIYSELRTKAEWIFGSETQQDSKLRNIIPQFYDTAFSADIVVYPIHMYATAEDGENIIELSEVFNQSMVVLFMSEQRQDPGSVDSLVFNLSKKLVAKTFRGVSALSDFLMYAAYIEGLAGANKISWKSVLATYQEISAKKVLEDVSRLEYSTVGK